MPTVPAAPPAPGGSASASTTPPLSQFDTDKAAWPPERPSLEVAKDKLAATLGDIALIARRSLTPKAPRVTTAPTPGAGGATLRLAATKPVVLVIGSGWGSHALSKVIDVDIYDVIVVSPTNVFCFTPMLPSTAVGTVEFRSILEPVRVSNPSVTYLEAAVDELDVDAKVARCTAASTYADGSRPTFEVPYDVVVVAVGEQSATFGVPGVREHCFFLKEIGDARALRQRVGTLFELAALPGTPDDVRRSLLSFVVVGGGPTGVEFAGTLSDFLRVDLKRRYPDLMPFVTVTLLQSGQSVLTVFSAGLQERALATLRREGVDVRLGVRVAAVEEGAVVLASGERVPHGLCLWSAGNSSRPLVRDLVQRVPSQAAYVRNPVTAKLAVDQFQRVVGLRDALAIGDCALTTGRPLPATAQVAGQQGAYVARLLNKGYRVGVGGVTSRPPTLPSSDRAAVLQSWEAAVNSMDAGDRGAAAESGGSDGSPGSGTPAGRAVARALARLRKGDAGDAPPPSPFEFLSLGILAYVGSDKGVSEVEVPGGLNLKVSGYLSFLLWRSVYITKQVSTRNRVLILFDWIKTRVFGRDLSLF